MCSVRRKVNLCSVLIKQKGDNFYSMATVSHTHPARPGILTTIKIKSQCKNTGLANVFESAINLVSSINNELSDPSRPEAARPNHNTLIRIVNTARASCRPKDPSDMSYDVSKRKIQHQ